MKTQNQTISIPVWQVEIFKSNLNPPARHILLTLSLYGEDCAISTSIDTIARDTGYPSQTIIEYLDLAEAAGFISYRMTSNTHVSIDLLSSVADDQVRLNQIVARQSNKVYKWQGRVIKLNERDYNMWKAAYSAIPDFDAELMSLDSFLSQNPNSNWFMFASGALKNKHVQAISTAKTSQKPTPDE
jgi:hypothetical protein